MFGPVDIKDSEPEPISASEMADVLNSLISPLVEYELLDKSQIESIQRLVEDLMGTKDNMNYAYSDEDHPMRDLIQENEAYFMNYGRNSNLYSNHTSLLPVLRIMFLTNNTKISFLEGISWNLRVN